MAGVSGRPRRKHEKGGQRKGRKSWDPGCGLLCRNELQAWFPWIQILASPRCQQWVSWLLTPPFAHLWGEMQSNFKAPTLSSAAYEQAGAPAAEPPSGVRAEWDRACSAKPDFCVQKCSTNISCCFYYLGSSKQSNLIRAEDVGRSIFSSSGLSTLLGTY